MNFYNYLLSFIFLFSIFVTTGFSSFDVKLDSRKNAALHNNQGIEYLREGDIYAAIASFKIAVGLNPNSEASSTFYCNLGNAYLKVGYYNLAEECYLAAIRFSPMNFAYYQKLVHTYKLQNKLTEKLFETTKVGNNMDNVVDGLIYFELGEYHYGKALLQSFIKREPNLIISKAIVEFLNNTGTF